MDNPDDKTLARAPVNIRGNFGDVAGTNDGATLSGDVPNPRTQAFSEYLDRLKPGQILDGKYKIIRELGRGGAGIVLEVENVFINSKFALKIIDLRSSNSSSTQRFQREAKVLNKLDHPNIVKAIDFGILDDTVPYVLMELVQGQTLSQYLQGRGALSEDEATLLMIPLLEALDYAHHFGIVHRDLKPGNIILAKDRQGKVIPKLLDFGLACYTEGGQDLTRTGEILGTPLYMSPEQIGGEQITERCDIYSIGCVMFHVLSGAPPFHGRTSLETMMLHRAEPAPTLAHSSLGLKFSPTIEQVVARMLEKDGSDRPQSCAEIVQVLKSGEVARLSSSTGSKRSNKKGATQIRPDDRVKLIALAALLIGVLTGGFLLGNKFSAKTTKEEVAATTTQATSAPDIKIAPNVSATQPSIYQRFGTTKEYYFPTQERIGILTWEAKDLTGKVQRVSVDAKGQVSIPVSASIELTAEEPMLKHPDYFVHFGTDALKGVTLYKNLPWTKEHVAAISKMRNLQSLGLGDTNLTDDCIQYIDNLPKLTNLTVSDASITGSGLAQMRHLSNIKCLQARGILRASDLLKALAKKSSLIELHLNASNLSDNDTKLLAKISSLETLFLGSNAAISNAGLANLAVLPKVSVLGISFTDIKSSCIPILRRMHALKQITISPDNWTVSDVSILEKDLKLKVLLTPLGVKTNLNWNEPPR
jgi:serine/threonine protein kinase